MRMVGSCNDENVDAIINQHARRRTLASVHQVASVNRFAVYKLQRTRPQAAMAAYQHYVSTAHGAEFPPRPVATISM